MNPSRRIGILTFFTIDNYGALLQSYALLSKLRELGAEAQIINYNSVNNRSGLKQRLKHGVWCSIRMLFGYRIRKRKCLRFLDDYLGINNENRVYDISGSESIKKYDCLIVGSDQVWNPSITLDSAYRLDFAMPYQEKVSYAASFGCSDLPSQYIPLYQDSFRSFSSVSVRELSGLKIMEKLGIKADLCLDPTLLYTGEEWLHLLHIHQENSEQFVLCYLLSGNSMNLNIIKKAREFAKEKNLRLLVIGAREPMRLVSSSFVNYAGPKDFVQLINSAKYIFTNSFHGVCFSVLCCKPFNVFLKKGFARNNRIVELLTQLNLTCRIHYSFDEDLNQNTIEYQNVNNKLAEMRTASLAFLNKIIDKTNQ